MEIAITDERGIARFRDGYTYQLTANGQDVAIAGVECVRNLVWVPPPGPPVGRRRVGVESVREVSMKELEERGGS